MRHWKSDTNPMPLKRIVAPVSVWPPDLSTLDTSSRTSPESVLCMDSVSR